MDHLLVEWRGLPGRWEPFPDLFRRLIGGDWWYEISEERGGQAPAEPTGEVIEPLSLGEQVAPGVEAARTEQQQAWCRHLAAGGSWWAAPKQAHADAQTRGDCHRLSLRGVAANLTGSEPAGTAALMG